MKVVCSKKDAFVLIRACEHCCLENACRGCLFADLTDCCDGIDAIAKIEISETEAGVSDG